MKCAAAWLVAWLLALSASLHAHESDSRAKIHREDGTNRWFGTLPESGGRPVFSVDLDRLQRDDVEYPVEVCFGPDWKPFCWFSGKWDMYFGESYAREIVDVAASDGPQAATLSYTLRHPPRGLEMPTQLILQRGDSEGSFVLRVRQSVRATTEPTWGDNVEFLHLVTNPKYGRDWEDAVPDYAWYRVQREDAADTLAGSHTTLARLDDDSRRAYPYPVGGGQTAKSGIHHTNAAVAMEAANTIGGWFTKTGSGCIGLVFHEYRASFRRDLSPLHSHCGDGADTHFYVFWGSLFQPLGMKSGDRVDIEYSLTMLPSEPLHTDIEDLNEADLFFFGKEQEQRSPVAGWLGTKHAIGLRRGDGSAILWGIGETPGRVTLPATTAANAKRVFRMSDLGRPRYEPLLIEDGSVEVHPRCGTLVDCGAALHGPEPAD